MTEQEKALFEKLSADRSDSAKTLTKPSMRGVQHSVVEKYSDQAHFIYELLQNADDVGATACSFELHDKELVFRHNGTRHFAVSDPDTEEEDAKNNQLGDLNSITSIANTTKNDQSTIGKFGVGFKAVFQYTTTPHIYDRDFCFRIEQFIVPVLLNKDYPGRGKEETVFIFPFNHPDRNAETAYEDIKEKLQKLSYPNLFLNHLETISFDIAPLMGQYGKRIICEKTFENTTARLVEVTQKTNEKETNERIWIFSGKDENGNDYCVGFFLDKKGKLQPVCKPAFCFFPTRENTNLNFIIHGPFLLNDSREGIKAGEQYNRDLIQSLSELAADSLDYLRQIGDESKVRLIDDDVLDIVPITEDDFSDIGDRNQISFLPFYEEMKEALANGLLPGRDGYYCKHLEEDDSTENDFGVICDNFFESTAYWADTKELYELFTDKQLTDLLGGGTTTGWLGKHVREMHFVFCSYGRNSVGHNAKEGLQEYIDDITHECINEWTVFSKINEGFVKCQSHEWLCEFYKWINDSPKRFDRLKSKPIFLDSKGNATAAYNEKGEKTLFLPTNEDRGCATIDKRFLDDPEIKDFLIHTVKLEEPSLKDYIYNVVLPQYQKGFHEEDHFLLFFDYYKKCKQEDIDEFIQHIKTLKFLNGISQEGQKSKERARALYYPFSELKEYFSAKPAALFIDYDDYLDIVGKSNQKYLDSFLTELGVNWDVALKVYTINENTAKRRHLPDHASTKAKEWKETVIDGCNQIITFIVDSKESEKSFLLWNVLLKVVSRNCSHGKTLTNLLRGKLSYFYYSQKEEEFVSSNVATLRNKKWLVNKHGEFVSPTESCSRDLSPEYNLSHESAKQLIEFLFAESPAEKEYAAEANAHLTEAQKTKIAIGQKLLDAGIDDPSVLDSLIRDYQRQKSCMEASNVSSNETGEQGETGKQGNEQTGEPSGEKNSLTQVIETITSKAKPKSKHSETAHTTLKAEEDCDADEYTPRPVDIEKKIERAQEKCAEEIEKLALYDELLKKANEFERYSFGWFNTLLELETLAQSDSRADSREVSISFAKVEREPDTTRTLVLKHPNRYIPSFMEDLADIPLVLHFAGQTKTVAIEVANIKSYTLRVKLKNNADLDGLDLQQVTEAHIDAKSPAFLLEELKKQFAELGKTKENPEGYPDDFDMQGNLCENIEFVFGPPGTGKTTHLAKNVLIPLMQEKKDNRVLVLTPTNKSADVLTSRIMDAMGKDHSYENWLVRFGNTADETIEASAVFREKTIDIRAFKRNVTVTTIARFPYDFFMPENGDRVYLKGYNWDYIVIDEASMIPLANIVYPLYLKTPKKFYIAGDPFQIEPIVSVDVWKNENIYTMVHLDSFVDCDTVPHPYPVTHLTTQYRSVPEIGTLFSKVTYGGILQHHRTSESRKDLHIDATLDVEPLNIIKFPVQKYESIYRSKRLQHSSAYHIYSALFSFEFAVYLSDLIAKANPNANEEFTIGIIAPYRAQADLIEKLMVSAKLPEKVSVQVGTIHGFQGDECDMIIAVFNTPPTISDSKDMFLNKKNIINVSISRARDYLFVLMPDENTEHIERLKLVGKVEDEANGLGALNYESSELEQLMFGSSTYLEDNSFSTGHQNVNVYGLPEKRYEIRSEDSAVDVQIHEDTK